VFKGNRQAVSLTETRRSFVGLQKWMWGLLLIAIVGYFIVLAYMRMDLSTLLPITKVRALGDFNYVTEKMLNTALKDTENTSMDSDVVSVFDGKGFFNIDVDTIKARVEKMAWVKRASVQRVWPDTLVIEIAEHKPVAYWGAKGLVNDRGEVFYPDVKTYPKNLPHFINRNVDKITNTDIAVKYLRYYQDATDMFAIISLNIANVKFDARQALTLGLDNGMDLNVGRHNKLYRLQRFTQIYSTLRQRASFIENIDMRYTNGFSVKWKQHQVISMQDIKVKSDVRDV